MTLETPDGHAGEASGAPRDPFGSGGRRAGETFAERLERIVQPHRYAVRDVWVTFLAAAPLLSMGLILSLGLRLLIAPLSRPSPDHAGWLPFPPETAGPYPSGLVSAFGFTLIVLSVGLHARLRAAWAATLTVLLAAAALVLLNGASWIEALAWLPLAAILASLRCAFPLRSRMSAIETRGDDDPGLDRVRAILANAAIAEPSSNLALLGDKRFLFSPGGQSFLMFGVRGHSWLALGMPVGRAEDRLALMRRFIDLARSHAARPVFYGLDVQDLPDALDVGLSLQKIGETAVVPLASFSIDGRERGNLRRAWRKLGEDGARFEVLSPQAAAAVFEELRTISDDWLGAHAGGEKGFSMGGFHKPYVSAFPVAVVRLSGRIVAFASIWTTAARTTFSVDLMRYADASPKNVMDFLFVELIRWGRQQGYRAIDFGMAPLAGLDGRPLAPVMSRVGRMLFERGEEIYKFQGVYRYKNKYDPVWLSRYVAGPLGWTLPLALIDLGLLTSGGVRSLAKRPRRGKS
jgi:lysylphosphatidylglycerol synthetase-like protein (DUF2156 family)